jgi:hypothetical protein
MDLGTVGELDTDPAEEFETMSVGTDSQLDATGELDTDPVEPVYSRRIYRPNGRRAVRLRCFCGESNCRGWF